MRDEIFVHRCAECGAIVECIGTSAEFALENDWYISLYTEFCSKCRKTEYAQRVIKDETARFKRLLIEFGTARKIVKRLMLAHQPDKEALK